ncbi:protein bric-a-brac 1 isoform X2 [Procambarus clarkii]|uniref:protein bric-a-brac 1 isoform X2 n=1 Tax=Procambarus clarkii TaxID=6728 RepID=UPI001E67400C|nr:protein bric-a-brac 1-like isoform X2 [Procambarus clarkii]
MAEGMLSLSWNNHSATFCQTLASLRAKERYTDVTVTCEGKFYPVHKLVLSTCSEYFENMFEHTPCKHPVIVLRDVQCDELEALLSYMYAGVVSVAQTDLPRLIKVAELLKIKGLAVPDEPPRSSSGSAISQKSGTGRSSPHVPRRHSQCSTNVRHSPYPKSRSAHSSSDKVSPHPKRQCSEEENTVLQDRLGVPLLSPSRSKESSHSTETDWQAKPCRSSMEEQQLGTQRDGELGRKTETSLQGPPSSQGSACEILIKEEVMEDLMDSEANSSETGLDYASLISNSELPTAARGDQGLSPASRSDHLDSTSLMKIEQSNAGQQPGSRTGLRQDTYTEALNATLPGPSDLQGWFGGEAMTSISMAKGGIDDETQMFTQDMLQQPHERDMLENENDMVPGCSRTRTGSGKNQSTTVHQCHYCAYSTHRKYDLNKHIRTHTGEKPFSCPYCTTSFAQNSAVKAHLRLVHSVEKPHTCPHCNQRFSRKKLYQNHLCMHNEFSCLYCCYTSDKQSELNEHIRIHSNCV